MVKPHGRIEEQVSKNDRRARRVDARVIAVDGTPSRDTVVRRLELDLQSPDSDWAIEERDLGNAAIAGHPDAKHGAGRGEVGDTRGTWSAAVSLDSITTTTVAAEAVASLLAGTDVDLDATISVGDGGTDATRDKSSLANETNTLTASRARYTNEISVVAGLRFQESKPTVDEFQLDLSNGDSAAQASSSQVSSWDSEVRFTGRVAIEGRDRGPVMVNEGDEALAKTLFGDQSSAVDVVEIGTGSGPVGRSTTDLSNEIDERSVAATASAQTVTATEDWPSDEPSGQPYDVTEVSIRLDTGELLAVAQLQAVRLDENASPSFGGVITITPRS